MSWSQLATSAAIIEEKSTRRITTRIEIPKTQEEVAMTRGREGATAYGEVRPEKGEKPRHIKLWRPQPKIDAIAPAPPTLT